MKDVNLSDPLFTCLPSLLVAVCFAGWILPHEERGTGGRTSSCASQVACICGQHGSTRGLWAVSACRGGAGDRLCCFYWCREAPGESCPCSLLGINAERHLGINSICLSGFHEGIHEGHLSRHLRERLFPISESPNARASDAALLSALHQGVLGSRGTASGAVPCSISNMKSLGSYLL